MRAVTAYRITTASLLLLASTACSPDFEKFWQVTDLRVLAIQAYPPEVLFLSPPRTFSAVRITALVADPTAPDATVDWELWACTPEEISCEEAAVKEQVARGSSTQDIITTDFVLSQQLYKAALNEDPFKGFGGLPIVLELRVKRGEHTDKAIKHVVYGFALPLGKFANNNPTISEVLVDDKTMPDRWKVKAGEEVTLLPKTPTWDKEFYRVLTFTGQSRDLEEYLSYSYFTTSGELSSASTGGKPMPFVTDQKVEDISTIWIPERGVTSATIWVVVRDDRGGAGWIGPMEVGITE